MKNNNSLCSSYEIAFLLSGQHGLTRQIAIITTFFFWFCLSALALVFLRLNLISLAQLSQMNQALAIVGLSPLLLTVFSWRIIEKIYSYYLTWYANKYTEIEKNS